VPESAKEVTERAVELFNRDMGSGTPDPGPDTRALWAPEPVIVPLRAELEGISYTGPTAFDDFIAESLESWTQMEIDADEFRELDAEHALVIGSLVGRARETGLEMRAPVAFLFVVKEGLITMARTFPSERAALEALGR
jgi:ketosteroid isomerase-like protein